MSKTWKGLDLPCSQVDKLASLSFMDADRKQVRRQLITDGNYTSQSMIICMCQFHLPHLSWAGKTREVPLACTVVCATGNEPQA